MTVIEHIESIYAKTKFEYFSYLEVVDQFPDKEDARRQLNELRNQGIVRKRAGMNGVLIEYLGKLRKEFETKNTIK